MYYTYIVRCSDESLYTGWTTDVERRIEQHNEGLGAKYTRAKLPVSLVYVKEFSSKQEAMQWEYATKKLSRADKLQMIQAKGKS